MNKNQLSIAKKFTNKAVHVFECIHLDDNKMFVSNGIDFFGVKTNLPTGIKAFVDLADFTKISARGVINSLSLTDSQLNINIGAKVFKLNADQDILKLPDNSLKEVGTVTINKEFLTMKSFVGKDELRPAMTGLHFDSQSNRLAATDAHCMKWIDTDLRSENDLILSSIIFNLPLGEYKYQILEKHLYLENEDIFAYISLIDERYPNYKCVIPSSSEIDISLSKKDLKEILDDAIICANQTTKLIVMHHQGNSAKLEFSSEDIDLKKSYKGEASQFESNNPIDFKIGFSIGLMNTVLSSIDSDQITLSCTTPTRAIVINGNTLCMPTKLD